ncbi:helix-turn-helix domain-containing protein [Streptomyces sp. NPDC087859]|uniref:helix-turn-helix domain-containing protein n=1 Tax=Streptomyces sp. NPDC087859 TaxID=3365812 RepID=UPI0037F8E878
MRYAQGGGLTDAERAARERIRLQAVVRFEGGETNREAAAALRVSERSVERWRRAWRERGEAGSCRGVLQGGPGSAKRRTSRRASAGGISATWSSALVSSSGPDRAGLGQRPAPPDRRYEGIHRGECRVADRVTTPGLRR